MRLIPWEEERLQLFAAAELARRRRAAGLRLNHPEAVALICDAMLEAARAGGSYAEVEAAGRAAVDPADVMDGVRELLDRGPARGAAGRRDAGSSPCVDPLGRGDAPDPLGPGALLIGDPVGRRVNEGREAIELEVASRSRRRIRVSSHYPFHRVNPRLEFDREAARGFHLDLPAGAYAGWEPGETKTVRLVRYAGGGRTDDGDPPLRRGVPGALRPDDRRPGPPRRHRPLDPRRRRPHRARRRAGLGLREEPPQPDRPVGRRDGPVGARRRPPRRARRRPRHRRRQGRHRHQGRPHRGHRPGRQPRDQRRHRPRHRPPHEVVHGLRADRDPGRRRHPRPHDRPRAPAARARRPASPR